MLRRLEKGIRLGFQPFDAGHGVGGSLKLGVSS
jgi:hypothetical protein